MSSRIFLSPETELFYVKTHIIHALAETTSEAYTIPGDALVTSGTRESAGMVFTQSAKIFHIKQKS